MEETTFVVKRERVRPSEGELPAITYRLMEGETDGRPSYSVFCFAEDGRGLYEEAAFLPDVTSDAGKAEALLTMLYDGAVTPYALTETVAEWIE